MNAAVIHGAPHAAAPGAPGEDTPQSARHQGRRVAQTASAPKTGRPGT